MVDRIKNIINLLERVSSEEIAPEQALKQWPDIEAEIDELVAASWHELTHFQNDSDIREKDVTYDEYMKASLLNFAKRLKEKYKIS